MLCDSIAYGTRIARKWAIEAICMLRIITCWRDEGFLGFAKIWNDFTSRRISLYWSPRHGSRLSSPLEFERWKAWRRIFERMHQKNEILAVKGCFEVIDVCKNPGAIGSHRINNIPCCWERWRWQDVPLSILYYIRNVVPTESDIGTWRFWPQHNDTLGVLSRQASWFHLLSLCLQRRQWSWS